MTQSIGDDRGFILSNVVLCYATAQGRPPV